MPAMLRYSWYCIAYICCWHQNWKKKNVLLDWQLIHILPWYKFIGIWHCNYLIFRININLLVLAIIEFFWKYTITLLANDKYNWNFMWHSYFIQMPNRLCGNYNEWMQPFNKHNVNHWFHLNNYSFHSNVTFRRIPNLGTIFPKYSAVEPKWVLHTDDKDPWIHAKCRKDVKTKFMFHWKMILPSLCKINKNRNNSIFMRHRPECFVVFYNICRSHVDTIFPKESIKKKKKRHSQPHSFNHHFSHIFNESFVSKPMQKIPHWQA